MRGPVISPAPRAADDVALRTPGAAEVASAAQLACLLEASAPKPGNVHPGAAFTDARFEDYLASAAAIGPALLEAGERPLGAVIRAAVEATRRWTSANTNLGMILLLAPLARAALLPGPPPLRSRLRDVLATTTVDDAAEVYAAIRLAQPGGLGRTEAQDVAGTPTVTLTQAMTLAAHRDAVAREYTTAFALTFETGAPALATARAAGLDWRDAIVECFLVLLAASPDTLIGRKLGEDAAALVSRRAREVLDAGGVRTATGRAAVAALDRELRDGRNRHNPGTTADLTAVAIFVALLGGERPGARTEHGQREHGEQDGHVR